MKVTLTKKSKGSKAACPPCPKGAAPVAFNLQDNQDDTLTVLGVDASGATLDISAVATLAVSSDNTALLTVDAPVGMTSTMHGLAVGACNLTATATWNDGSIGPFTFVLPITLVAGGPTGIIIQPGTPTVRP